MEDVSLLIVGLGNPSSPYRLTRHNVGREFVEALQTESGASFSESRHAEYFRVPAFFSAPKAVVAAIPKTFMNQSGFPVMQLLQQENAPHDRLFVVVDDFMIPFGTLRMRSSGSSGGHNGLKSIIETLGTEDFPRLRIGVGPVPGGIDPADFVLERFASDEQKRLPELYATARKGIEIYLSEGAQKAMSFLNKEHA